MLRGNHWHKSAGCVVAVSENCDLMYDSEVGHRAGCVRPVCLGDLQSDDAQTFLIVVGEGWHDPYRWRVQLAVSAGSRCSWTSKPPVVVTISQVGTGFIKIQLAKVLDAGTVSTAATGDGIVFVKGSVRVSRWTTMSRTFDTLGNHTVDVVFDNLGFQACGNCRGRSSSPLGLCRP